MPENRTYRPAEGRENMRLSQSLADRDEPLSVTSWPYTTDDIGEQTALDAHPWVRADDAPASSAPAPQQSGGSRRSQSSAPPTNSSEATNDQEGE